MSTPYKGRISGMERVKVRIRGIVQGVGFRPFIYSLANRYSLKGFVLNDTKGVVIEAEGERPLLKKFLSRLRQEAPPLSRIKEILTQELPPLGYKDFYIKPSAPRKERFVLISPDIATCEKCLRELFDPQDRRFGYPFINCTNCGPRFTIIKDIPYDRDKTTMKEFPMCKECQGEYDNPLNRRFHAQPNCCPECGPEVELVSSELKVESRSNKAVEDAVRLIEQGKILAIKGLGGFHLACDAQNRDAVQRLRAKKYREEKPFAVMAKDIDTVRRFCLVNRYEEELLLSKRRPIVLLRKQRPDILAPQVAPKQKYHGVMLPYTPLHYLLFSKLTNPKFDVLVMTSGNLSEEPICYKNQDALNRLRGIADYFLLHNRDIYIRCDDSVTRCFEGREMVIRRSRGYVPEPIELPFKLKRALLSCGAELKNTFCIARDNYAFLSHHIGDLENLETLLAFEQGIEHFKRIFSIEPQVIAYDPHPEYLSTKYAKQLSNSKLFPVQHHHAHIASCMADNGIEGKVIGVAFDGLGYGTDGNLWGGEFLIADFRGFQRFAHLRYIPMPGGTRAIREPWRMALSYLYHTYKDGLFEIGIDFVKKIDKKNWNVLKNLMIHRINSPLTSSMGRFFDAVSALLGICLTSEYEGQAAIELEMVAEEMQTTRCKMQNYGYTIREEKGEVIIEPEDIILGIVEDMRRSFPPEVISFKFHNTIATMVSDICIGIRQRTGLDRVALSGGVFQNTLLLSLLVKKLRKEGFKVYIHHRVPTNDGGISLGQTVVASQRV